MAKILINLGLAIIPFFIWVGSDTRQPKMILALIISLALSLFVLYKDGFKRYGNLWLLLLIGYIPLSFALAPDMIFDIKGIHSGCLWYWKAYLFIVVFFMAHVAVSNIGFVKYDINRILKIMCWAGFIMAIYSLLQKVGFEQFFGNREGVNAIMTGTLGNVNILASFLVMIIPIALYSREYLKAIIMLLVVIVSSSQMAMGALLLSIIFLIGSKSKKLAIITIISVISLGVIIGVSYNHSTKVRNFLADNGRFGVWKQIYGDIKNPIDYGGVKKSFAFTGYGIGSFRYLFHNNHEPYKSEHFYEAHNEYLEFMYNTGIIGILLLFMSIWAFLKACFPLNSLKRCLISSLVSSIVCAIGMYVWQLGPTIFYTIILTGLLNNEVTNV